MQCFSDAFSSAALNFFSFHMCDTGLYAEPNYCQSHMFWWTHGCELLSKFTNFKMCLLT